MLNLNQAAINGIRAAGATTQYIFVEGNHYSGAWTWADNNDNLKGLKDPEDKIVFEMHQYLDSDGSGTSESCVSSTIGQERVESATQWLKDNSLKGFLGEFAGGVNSQCETAVEGLLSYMSENSDVWLGAEWWSAGPMWGNYMYSLEPSTGPAYSSYLPILKNYFVSGTSSSSSSSSSITSSTTSVNNPTTSATTQAQVVNTSSSSLLLLQPLCLQPRLPLPRLLRLLRLPVLLRPPRRPPLLRLQLLLAVPPSLQTKPLCPVLLQLLLRLPLASPSTGTSVVESTGPAPQPARAATPVLSRTLTTTSVFKLAVGRCTRRETGN